jgi:hypothetical protein
MVKDNQTLSSITSSENVILVQSIVLVRLGITKKAEVQDPVVPGALPGEMLRILLLIPGVKTYGRQVIEIAQRIVQRVC